MRRVRVEREHSGGRGEEEKSRWKTMKELEETEKSKNHNHKIRCLQEVGGGQNEIQLGSTRQTKNKRQWCRDSTRKVIGYATSTRLKIYSKFSTNKKESLRVASIPQSRQKKNDNHDNEMILWEMTANEIIGSCTWQASFPPSGHPAHNLVLSISTR